MGNKLNEIQNYGTFEKIYISTLDKHAPLRKKVLRANQAPYMIKTLRKAIMRRSQLQTMYFKNKSQSNYLFKNINLCNKLYKNERSIMMH